MADNFDEFQKLNPNPAGDEYYQALGFTSREDAAKALASAKAACANPYAAEYKAYTDAVERAKAIGQQKFAGLDLAEQDKSDLAEERAREFWERCFLTAFERPGSALSVSHVAGLATQATDLWRKRFAPQPAVPEEAPTWECDCGYRWGGQTPPISCPKCGRNPALFKPLVLRGGFYGDDLRIAEEHREQIQRANYALLGEAVDIIAELLAFIWNATPRITGKDVRANDFRKAHWQAREDWKAKR